MRRARLLRLWLLVGLGWLIGCDDAEGQASAVGAPDAGRAIDAAGNLDGAPLDAVTTDAAGENDSAAEIDAAAENDAAAEKDAAATNDAAAAHDGALSDSGTASDGGPPDCSAESSCVDAGQCTDAAGDGGCPDGLRCDPATGACAAQRCADDTDCPEAFYCALERGPSCQLGCRLDGCGVVGDCDPGRRLCVIVDRVCDPERCPEGTRCLPARFDCAGLAACPNGDADCRGDEHCDAETGRCVVGCLDDAFERQDGFADAPALVLSPPDADGARHGSAEDRIVCPGTRDFYAVTLAPGERMRVTADCGGALDCLDARVFHENLFDHSDLFDDIASAPGFDYPPLGASREHETTYTLEIIGHGRVAYRLDVRTTLQGCFPDDSEPNDSAETGRAASRRDDFFEDQSLCADDEDWFCGEPGANGGLDFVLSTTPPSDPVSVELFALSRASAPDGLIDPNYDAEDVSVEMTPDGTLHRFRRDPDTASFSDEPWCARVRLADGGVAAEYAVRFRIVASDDFACDLVANGTFDTAVDLDAVLELAQDGLLTPDFVQAVPVDGDLCPRDEDYFCLTAAAGDTLQAWLVGDGVAGTLTVQFFDPLQRPIGPAVEHTGSWEPAVPAETRAPAAGRYCILVDGEGPSQGTYDLFVRRTPRADP
ncbi:MAG: hypothetical protein KC583_01170 [Myxococcales bacterium]|nr:hypothetical protein [Myxococcales bacterium]